MSIDVGQAGGIPNGATFVSSASGNVANANAVATLTGVVGRVLYLLGCVIVAGGATAALIVNATITGLVSSTWTIPIAAPAGVLVAAAPVVINFGGGVPSVVNNNVVVTLPALGTGNTNAAVVAWGFYL